MQKFQFSLNYNSLGNGNSHQPSFTHARMTAIFSMLPFVVVIVVVAFSKFFGFLEEGRMH